MRYFSDKLNKFFETEEECKNAEKETADVTENKDTCECKVKDTPIASKEVSQKSVKKQLLTNIDSCRNAVDKAYSDYEIAKDKAAKILEESNKQVEDILNPAKDNIKKAQEAWYKAIDEFNNKFGPYVLYYTGERAAKEYVRLNHIFNDIFKLL